MRELNEFEKDFFTDTITDEPPVDDLPPSDDPPADDIPPSDTAPADDTPPPDDVPPSDEYIPPYKGKKFIEVADEAELYNQLDKKYGHTKISADAKALAFIKNQNPELNDDELAFMAATDYGIGVDRPDEKELDDKQVTELRKQDIARKKLITQADNFFKSQAEGVALTETDPLDLDPGYKTYREQVAAQQTAAAKAAENIKNINTNFDKTSTKIPEVVENISIDIDDNKFEVPVKFKMDAKKQEQLADFAKRYQPSKAEFDAFNDPESGKFDYEGYLKSLIPMAFGKEFSKAATRQALSKDRENFISKELKNSSLKDQVLHKTVPTEEFDLVDSWRFGN